VSVAENKALVRPYLEEVVNTGNVGRIAEFIAPDYIDRNDLADLLGPLLVMGAIQWVAPENPFVNG
jgi:hypothetical protein